MKVPPAFQNLLKLFCCRKKAIHKNYGVNLKVNELYHEIDEQIPKKIQKDKSMHKT